MSEQATHDWVIGCELSVTTQSEDIRGQVFAFDKSTNTVVLRQPGSTPFHSNLRLLKVNFIKVLLPHECPFLLSSLHSHVTSNANELFDTRL